MINLGNHYKINKIAAKHEIKWELIIIKIKALLGDEDSLG